MLSAFENPVQDAQVVFRALLKSMSEPGTRGTINSVEFSEVESGTQIYASTWAIAQALFDYDTSIYLSADMQSDVLAKSIQFQTDAHITDRPESANFALISMKEMTDLTCFNAGTLEAPHESCTVIIQVEGFNEKNTFQIRGPGIKDSRSISIDGLTQRQHDMIMANQQLYPCGVDLIFCAPTEFIALPRTTRLVPALQDQGEPLCM
uniref:COG3625 Uncharacterized enzyme of phosphonate metabolism n=1 Tax=uncultured bacterium B3TF_MPn1 TaxID=1439866 RepID=W0NUP5_9BACT|nr:COG3625 Uncharacterized enzyme of phosphonate metabolism [uncultured bacterium B3TF_MPn1]